MNFRLTEEDMKRLSEDFPHAERFLVAANLRFELKELTGIKGKNAWQRARVAELVKLMSTKYGEK